MREATSAEFLVALTFVQGLAESKLRTQLLDLLADNAQDILRGNDDDVD